MDRGDPPPRATAESKAEPKKPAPADGSVPLLAGEGAPSPSDTGAADGTHIDGTPPELPRGASSEQTPWHQMLPPEGLSGDAVPSPLLPECAASGPEPSTAAQDAIPSADGMYDAASFENVPLLDATPEDPVPEEFAQEPEQAAKPAAPAPDEQESSPPEPVFVAPYAEAPQLVPSASPFERNASAMPAEFAPEEFTLQPDRVSTPAAEQDVSRSEPGVVAPYQEAAPLRDEPALDVPIEEAERGIEAPAPFDWRAGTASPVADAGFVPAPQLESIPAAPPPRSHEPGQQAVAQPIPTEVHDGTVEDAAPAADIAPSYSPARTGDNWTAAKSIGVRGAKVAAIVFSAWFGLVLFLIIAYRFVNPPFSALMALQWMGGTTINQQWVPLEAMSPNLMRAVIASEDGRFCSHWGIDYAELAAAIKRAPGGTPRGASTITMQVAKNLFLWPAKSYVRKVIEVPLTYAIELFWPKRRILEVYLNIAEWGPGIFGAEAASQAHFGRSAEELSAREGAQLAVALPNPFTRDPGDPGPWAARRASLIQRLAARAPEEARCVVADE